MTESKFSISSQHPSLAGHFPGRPIVPGVVILDEVMHCIRQSMHSMEMTAMPTVKFLAPLLPETQVQVSIDRKQESLLAFRCYADDRLICSGQVRIKV